MGWDIIVVTLVYLFIYLFFILNYLITPFMSNGSICIDSRFQMKAA